MKVFFRQRRKIQKDANFYLQPNIYITCDSLRYDVKLEPTIAHSYKKAQLSLTNPRDAA